MVENVGKKCLFEEMCILNNDNYRCLGQREFGQCKTIQTKKFFLADIFVHVSIFATKINNNKFTANP